VNRANGASEKDVNPLLSSLPPFMKFASFASCRWGKNKWTIGLCFQQTRKIITCSVHQCAMFRVWPFQRGIYLFYSSFISFSCVWDTAREGPQERCILIALWRGLLNRIMLNLLHIYIVPIIFARFADDVWLMTSLFPWCLWNVVFRATKKTVHCSLAESYDPTWFEYNSQPQAGVS
jgi:hypothetical protein